MRIYEELFIIRPDAAEEEIETVVEQVRSTIRQSGGTIDKEEKWGVRRLAYKVQKRSEGFYVLIQFTAGSQTAREIERRLRVSDVVLKFITVRIDEKLKKLEKRKKAREKRAARKPVPVAPPPAMPMTEPPMAASSSPAMPGAPVRDLAPPKDNVPSVDGVSGEREE